MAYRRHRGKAFRRGHRRRFRRGPPRVFATKFKYIGYLGTAASSTNLYGVYQSDDVYTMPAYIAMASLYDWMAVTAIKLTVWPIAAGSGGLNAPIAAGYGSRRRGEVVIGSDLDGSSWSIADGAYTMLQKQPYDTSFAPMGDGVKDARKIFMYIPKAHRPEYRNIVAPRPAAVHNSAIFLKGENFDYNSSSEVVYQLVVQCTYYVKFYGGLLNT